MYWTFNGKVLRYSVRSPLSYFASLSRDDIRVPAYSVIAGMHTENIAVRQHPCPFEHRTV
jgi:hypothetical protein